MIDTNRRILKSLIKIVCFLRQQECGFRDHDVVSSNIENSQDLVSIIAKCEKDSISDVATISFKRINQETGEAPFIAIVLNEANNNFSPLAMVMR